MSLPEWNALLCRELVVDLDVNLKQVLNLARDAAHNVERPASPLTTFLVGYAAAQRGGSEQDVTDCVNVAAALAARWATEHPDDSSPAGG
jgi:hypothetical protein